jgi:hypothetical protein
MRRVSAEARIAFGLLRACVRRLRHEKRAGSAKRRELRPFFFFFLSSCSPDVFSYGAGSNGLFTLTCRAHSEEGRKKGGESGGWCTIRTGTGFCLAMLAVMLENINHTGDGFWGIGKKVVMRLLISHFDNWLGRRKVFERLHRIMWKWAPKTCATKTLVDKSRIDRQTIK